MSTVFRNGTILAGPLDDPVEVSAVEVRDGRVVAIGDDAAGDAVVDLDGRVLLPAFRDGHAHPLWGGLELSRQPLDHATSVEDVVAIVATYAEDNPDLEWVVGGPYDPTLLPDGLGDAAVLDRACTDRPVVLYATDHHTMWVNTAGCYLRGLSCPREFSTH